MFAYGRKHYSLSLSSAKPVGVNVLIPKCGEKRNEGRSQRGGEQSAHHVFLRVASLYYIFFTLARAKRQAKGSEGVHTHL